MGLDILFSIGLAVIKKKIAFISGYFNILHPGHMRLFKFAREHAEQLIVCVLEGGDILLLLMFLQIYGLNVFKQTHSSIRHLSQMSPLKRLLQG